MDPYLGEIRLFAGTFAPVGWNFCDGTLLDISTNDALYALIGTTYGGNGQTNFALPDLRGRVPMHQDTRSGTYVIGATGGVEQVTLTSAQIPSHTHAVNVTSTLGGGNTPDPTTVWGAALATCKLYVQDTGSTVLDTSIIQSSGNGLPHENRQSYLAMNYIIALAGLFPSQS